MPPRPSSSWIPYSAFSAYCTMSSSVISPATIALTGVVAAPPTSRPQDGQNLLGSGNWVPQREQYIRERYGEQPGGVKVRAPRAPGTGPAAGSSGPRTP